MRIAFFTSAFPVRSETFIVSQIAGLLDRGHGVDIYASVLNGASHLHSDFAAYRLLERIRPCRSERPAALLPRLRVRSGAWRAYRSRDLPVALRCLNFHRYGRSAVSLDVLDMAAHFLDRPAYDIVHCHFGPNGEDAAILKELGLLGGKLVVTFHLYDVQRGIETKGRAYRRLIRSADAVHSISKFNREWLEAFGFPAERIYYHPMGIRLPEPVTSKPAVSRKEVTILTVARLVPVKGIDVALAALHEVVRERSDVKVCYRIVGGGPSAERLAQLAQQLGIESSVQFCGPRDQEGVRRALAEADIFLLPSLAEALPVAIMEAMAFGLPVVATDVGSVAELVQDGETGCLVRAGDARALADALRRLLQRPEDWRRLGAAGRRRVRERHDIEVLSDRLVAHYETLIHGAARTSPSEFAAVG